MKTIRFTLSVKSIKQAVKETRNFEAKLKEFCEVLAKKLAFEAVAEARALFAGYSMYPTDSETLKNISCYPVRPGVWCVTSGTGQSWFFEYGTGPEGAKDPHPEGANYKSEGWVTKADGKDMATLYGWKPLTAADGSTVYYTEGQPAKPFMYGSRQHIQNREVADRIMREAFKEVFG